MSRLRPQLLAVLAALLVVLVSCQDDPGDAPVADPAEPAEDAEGAGGEEAADEASEPGADMDADADTDADTGVDDQAGDGAVEPDGEAAGGDLEEALAAIGSGPGQVTYEVQGSAMELEELDGFTIVQDPPRSATVLTGPSGALRVIQDGEGTYTCVEADGAWQCLDLGGNDEFGGMTDGLTPDVPSVEDLEDLELDQRATVTRPTIVGRAAVCLTFDGPEAEIDVAEICFDEGTGMLLRSAGSGAEGEFRLEAVEFREPDASLFELPAPPVDLGELGAP